MKYSIYLIFCLTFFAGNIFAQNLEDPNVEEAEPAYVLGEKHKITSSILGEERPFTVFLPNTYKNNTYTSKHYPVLVMLAGKDLLKNKNQ